MKTGTIEHALVIAAQTHDGQLDKGGEPYIWHAIRVALAVSQYGPEYSIVALLHDVIEDGGHTVQSLCEVGFAPSIAGYVGVLSRRPSEDYLGRYIANIALCGVACTVKMADLRDNMNLLRLPTVGEKDIERVAKYAKALERLRKSGWQG